MAAKSIGYIKLAHVDIARLSASEQAGRNALFYVKLLSWCNQNKKTTFTMTRALLKASIGMDGMTPKTVSCILHCLRAAGLIAYDIKRAKEEKSFLEITVTPSVPVVVYGNEKVPTGGNEKVPTGQGGVGKIMDARKVPSLNNTSILGGASSTPLKWKNGQVDRALPHSALSGASGRSSPRKNQAPRVAAPAKPTVAVPPPRQPVPPPDYPAPVVREYVDKGGMVVTEHADGYMVRRSIDKTGTCTWSEITPIVKEPDT